KVVFAETLANPTLEVIDFEKIANVAKRINVPFIVDNSLASPVILEIQLRIGILKDLIVALIVTGYIIVQV
ncbi:PLP-dependent transferase, partial [Clostridioides difficile]